MTHNKVGRPRIDPRDRTIAITVALPSKQFDQLVQRALDARRSLAAQVRAELKNEK